MSRFLRPPLAIQSLWSIGRRLPMWYRFHDEQLRLPWRAAIRLHWIANVRMLTRVRPTVVFVLVSLVPVALWIGVAFSVARTLPLDAGGWTVLHDRFLDALLLGLVPYVLLQHVAFMVAIEATYAPLVREVLGEMGMPVCAGCGQQLDRHPADATRACPECGRPVEVLGQR